MPRHNLLVVDGEVLSRLVIAEYLRECGYRVHEAASPEEATEVLGAPEVSIDLILLDVHGTNGSAGGFAFARWVRELHPAVKVILSSGAEKSADLAGELCEAGPLMKKPYDPKHALDRIKRLLAKVERDRRPSARAVAAGTA
jgi:CheY-like chemotaxis protein